jgi:type IV pilus assembly protein PilX
MKLTRTFRNQGGASLVVALMFLIVLTILGLVAVRSSTVQERMAGNDRDRAVAFEAAEAALRDAERDIQSNITSANPFDSVGSGAGAYTGDVASVPRYIIEVLPDLDPTPGNALNKKSSSSSTGGGTAFRITARGWGLRPGTQVELQSVYLKQ